MPSAFSHLHGLQVEVLPLRSVLVFAIEDVFHDDVVTGREAEDTPYAPLNALQEISDPNQQRGRVGLHVLGVREQEIVLEK